MTPSLINLYKRFASSPQGRWIMVWNNVQKLYQFCKDNDIKRVLDLGTGIGSSASIVALALQEKGVDYHIDSIEQSEKCIKLASDLIPAELKEHITIHKTNAIFWDTPVIPYQHFGIYDELPDEYYDLIIHDGPSPILVDGRYVDIPNGTIIKLLLDDKIKAGTFIAWDGRITALQALERYFSDNFFLAKPAVRGNNLNILQRKDNPVSFIDEKLEIMKTTGYFEPTL